jgi:RNA polymerase sigma-70 factor (ECF subfamily)
MNQERDWAGTLDRLLRGDRVAFLDTAGLITGFLAEWRAYEFRDEWDDVVQEVILAAVEAARSGRLRKPAALPGYLRTATRFKFVDWLRRRRPVPLDVDGEETSADLYWPPTAPPEEGGWEIWEAVRNLPENQQKVIVGVYHEGKTHAEVARDSGVPMGAISRHLREGLKALRQTFRELEEET